MTATTTRHIDTCVTAGSITQLSPPLPLLPSSPCSPSTDGPFVRPTAISARPNATLMATKSGRNKEKVEGKRHLGVSDETEQMGQRKQGEQLENHRLDPGKSPPQTTPTIASKMTCFAPSGGNPPSRQSITTQELKSSCRTRDECQAAQNQTYGPTGLESSPPESKELFTQTFLNEVGEWFKKWMVARAQRPPAGSEKLRDVRSDAIHIERERKSTSSRLNHSLSELTPQVHPPSPPPTHTSRFDASSCVVNPPRPSRLISSPPQLMK